MFDLHNNSCNVYDVFEETLKRQWVEDAEEKFCHMPKLRFYPKYGIGKECDAEVILNKEVHLYKISDEWHGDSAAGELAGLNIFLSFTEEYRNKNIFPHLILFNTGCDEEVLFEAVRRGRDIMAFVSTLAHGGGINQTDESALIMAKKNGKYDFFNEKVVYDAIVRNAA